MLEDQWGCPMGGSPQLSHLLADTLGMRLLLDHKEIPLPPAMILNSSHHLSPWKSHNREAKSTKIVELLQKEGRAHKVQQEISAFLISLKIKGHRKVVLKTCWPHPTSSPSPAFYSTDDPTTVSDAVLDILSEYPEGQAVLLEGFITTVPPRRLKLPQPPACIPRGMYSGPGRETSLPSNGSSSVPGHNPRIMGNTQ